MANCGAEHGKMCEKVDAHEKEIKEQIWPMIRSRLAARIFFWVLGGFGVILLFIVGWVDARSGKILEVDRAIAVIQTDMGYIKQSVHQINQTLQGKRVTP